MIEVVAAPGGGCANDYTYVHGDPIQQQDLNGREWWDPRDWGDEVKRFVCADSKFNQVITGAFSLLPPTKSAPKPNAVFAASWQVFIWGNVVARNRRRTSEPWRSSTRHNSHTHIWQGLELGYGSWDRLRSFPTRALLTFAMSKLVSWLLILFTFGLFLRHRFRRGSRSSIAPLVRLPVSMSPPKVGFDTSHGYPLKAKSCAIVFMKLTIPGLAGNYRG
jgi:hypothetical protein